MTKYALFAGAFLATMASGAFAGQGIDPESDSLALGPVPAAMRETCTTQTWRFGSGFDEVRSDCVARLVPDDPRNPALSGICMTYYGRRTCH